MRTSAAGTILAATALALGACGGDDDGDKTTTASSKGQTLTIAADAGGALRFNRTELTARAGTVTITMSNPSDLPHAVEIEGNGVEEAGETVEKGGTSSATADLEPGTYEFYCPVGNHRQAGMEGTLTVK